MGMPSRWPTAAQLRRLTEAEPNGLLLMQWPQRRLALIRLVIDEQSEAHGVTPIHLSTKPGEAQTDV